MKHKSNSVEEGRRTRKVPQRVEVLRSFGGGGGGFGRHLALIHFQNGPETLLHIIYVSNCT
jgi:hypothetical protein